MCHRNDRVEKITAIVNKHDQLAAKFPHPDQLNLDRFLKRTDLVIQQRLNSLKELTIPDNVHKKRSKYFFIGMTVLILQTCCFLYNGTRSDNNTYYYIYLVSLVGVFVLAIFGVLNALKGARNLSEIENQTQKRTSALENELLNQQIEVNNQKENLRRKLRLRYDKMYYCHRDDLVFIPGEALYAYCKDYRGYLTNVLEIKTS